MRILRYIGISSIAVGLGILMFLLFLRFAQPRRILSPIPDTAPVEGVQVQPPQP